MTDRSPRLFSVVIPARNVESFIGEQLAALAAQTFDGRWEVLVADNGSTDKTRKRVLEWSDRLPGLRLVDASGAPGRSRARNLGAADAKGDFLLFVDADDRVSPGWLAAMAAASEHSDLLGGAIVMFHIDREGNEIVDDGHASPSALDAVYGFLPFTRSCNLGVRTGVFRGCGGFSEAYKQAEDVELCWRLQLGGHPLAFVPDATVYYRVSRDSRLRPKTAYRDGQGVPQLYHDFRDAGMPRSSLRSAVRDVVGAVFHRPHRWFTPTTRWGLISRLAFRAGKLVGSMRHRVFYL